MKGLLIFERIYLSYMFYSLKFLTDHSLTSENNVKFIEVLLPQLKHGLWK